MRITFLLTTRCINYPARTRSFGNSTNQLRFLDLTVGCRSRSLFGFLSCATSRFGEGARWRRLSYVILFFFLSVFFLAVENRAIARTRARELTRGNVTRACFRFVVVSVSRTNLWKRNGENSRRHRSSLQLSSVLSQLAVGVVRVDDRSTIGCCFDILLFDIRARSSAFLSKFHKHRPLNTSRDLQRLTWPLISSVSTNLVHQARACTFISPRRFENPLSVSASSRRRRETSRHRGNSQNAIRRDANAEMRVSCYGSTCFRGI